jgi:DNA polymerase-3 subunit beta
MHFRMAQRDLAKLLQAAQGVVERKSTMRILECVLIEAGGEEVQVVATDLDVGTRLRAAAEVKEAGAICLPARKLHEIVRLLPADAVEVREREGGRVDLKCGRSSFRLPGLAREEYPALPQVGEEAAARLPRATLGGMIDKVAFAITTDDSRYALNGCLLSVAKGRLRLVASDGHRLACVTRALEGAQDPARPIEAIVPKKTIGELARMCGEEEAEEVEVALANNQVLFRCGGRELISRLVEGQFPNYEKVIPKENTNVVEIETARFGDALRRVSLLSSEHSRAVRLALAPDRLELSASSPEQGEASEVLEVPYRGEGVRIGFNSRYLLDFVAAAGSDRVSLALRDKDTQGLLEPAGEAGAEYRYVVMPMRLEDLEERGGSEGRAEAREA